MVRGIGIPTGQLAALLFSRPIDKYTRLILLIDRTISFDKSTRYELRGTGNFLIRARVRGDKLFLIRGPMPMCRRVDRVERKRKYNETNVKLEA